MMYDDTIDKNEKGGMPLCFISISFYHIQQQAPFPGAASERNEEEANAIQFLIDTSFSNNITNIVSTTRGFAERSGRGASRSSGFHPWPL